MSAGSRKSSTNSENKSKRDKDITVSLQGIEKAPTRIKGFDDVTFGGLPRGRPTLVAGAAGCGKTMFAMEFIVHGAVEFNEPGVFVTFEENVADLKKNFATLGYDLDRLIKDKKMVIDHVFLDRSLIMETGEYDVDALFIRLGYAIDSIGAKRISLDTIEVLFSGLSNHALLRSELVRLFRWLKDRGITTIVTGEKGVDYLRCIVEDNGPGISNRVKDKIFMRFQRGDTKAHGKGLGLHITKTLVEDYGGTGWKTGCPATMPRAQDSWSCCPQLESLPAAPTESSVSNARKI